MGVEIVFTGLGCFLLGALLAVLLLLRFPSCYTLLRICKCTHCLRCEICRQTRRRSKSEKETSVRAREAADDLPYAMTDLSFRAIEQRVKKEETAQELAEKRKYQQFLSQSRKNFHKYTPYKGRLKSGYPAQTGVPNEGYEYMHVDEKKKEEINAERKSVENHYYHVLEQQTQQLFNNIRRVSDDEELQYFNPNHIYFVLEPTTSKLTHIDLIHDTTERTPDHIYFVLDKQPQEPQEPQEHYIVPNISGQSEDFSLYNDVADDT